MKLVLTTLILSFSFSFAHAKCTDVKKAKQSFNDNCRAYFYVNVPEYNSNVGPGSDADKRCLCFAEFINSRMPNFWVEDISDECEFKSASVNYFVERFVNDRKCL